VGKPPLLESWQSLFMSGSNRQPSFFWQGALIVLPVIVLAAVGMLSLRQDKILARHEAAERAQTIADDVAAKAWTLLTNAGSGEGACVFAVDAAAQLAFPPPYPTLPIPRSFDMAKLSTDQAELWTGGRQAEMSENGRSSAINAYRKFLDLKPPAEFRATARFALAVLLVREKQLEAAANILQALLQEDPDAVGESGLPLEPMAELKFLELADRVPGKMQQLVSVETICSNSVCRPTAVSPVLLRSVAERSSTSAAREIVRTWRARWDSEELSRTLFQSAREHTAPSNRQGGPEVGMGILTQEEHMFWFTSPAAWKRTLTNSPTRQTPAGPDVSTVNIEGSDWLGIQTGQAGSNRWFSCLGESDVGFRLSKAVDAEKNLPEYFAVGLEVAGRKLTWSVPDLRLWHDVNYFGRRGGGEKKELLNQRATTVLASASPFGTSSAQLKVNVYLTSEAALFKRQYARTFWFGSLVAAAALAALGGFLAAYRAFHRQLTLSEMKSNFVSSVSHELRAPIASVRLMAESLERGKVVESPRQQEYFRFIVQECRRLSALIENVLDFARIEQGRKEYELEPTDIVALLTQAVKLMEPYSSERHVLLALSLNDWECSIDKPQLLLDSKAIQQALINLIYNAIKHSPKGGTVKVGLTLENARCGEKTSSSPPLSLVESANSGSADSRHVQLWVEDHGSGIPPEEHEKIFERFYRRGSELRRETSGVGIGLSIVKHIVEAHGGRVLVRSEVGQGTRFTIRLPMTGSGEPEMKQ
jgi:signal transduction histidine kinase